MLFLIKLQFVTLCMILKPTIALVDLGRYSRPYLYIYKNILHTQSNIFNISEKMVRKINLNKLNKVAKAKNKKVKTEGDEKEKKKASTTKVKKEVKKETKTLKQTKLDFGNKTTTSSNWAKYPPLDPKEDIKEAFNKILELRKKSNVYIGAHVSASGGPEFSVANAYNILGQSFALFLKNQRSWNWKPLSDKSVENFKSSMSTYNYDTKFVLPHASYLINVANPEPAKRNRAFENFLDDIKRCELLGINLYNFHPGSTCGLCEKEEGIKNISDCINKAHKMTKGVTIVLENAAGQNNVIGSTFDDLKNIIDQVEDKTRVGICLDTCHLFAAGYDIRTTEQFENVVKEFDKVVGLKYLRAVHLNDSKSDLGSGLDRHENIGKGKLTEETFRFIVNSKYFKNIPVILETPTNQDENVYKQEVKLMYSLFEEK